MKTKKIIRRSLRILVALVLVLSLAIGVLLNFIFTPEKITPKALAIANEFLVGEVKCERIELTFFSSFPNFGLKFEEGLLLPPPNYADQDTLVQFKEAKLSFNLYKFLQKDEVDIKNIQLNEPQIYFQLDSLGDSNWNILKPELAEEEPQDTTDQLEIKAFNIENLEINHAHARYKDGVSQLNYAINDFNLILNLAKDDKGLGLNLKNLNKEIAIYRVPEKQFKIEKTGMDAELYFSFSDTLLSIQKSNFIVNDIAFQNKGEVQFYPQQKRSFINIDSELQTKSLKNIIDLIPSTYLAKKEVTTQGDLQLQLHTEGFYAKDEYPKLSGSLQLENASLAYTDFPGKISDLTAHITSEIDAQKPENSFATIQDLKVVGTGINLQSSGDIQQVLLDPKVQLQVNGNLNLTQLYQAFPFDENIKAAGTIFTKINTNFLASQLQNSEFEDLEIEGEVQLKDLAVASIKDSLSINSKRLDLHFFKDKEEYNTLASKIDIINSNVEFKNQFQASAEKLAGKVWVKQTGKRKAQLNGQIALKKLNFKAQDSIWGFIQNAQIDAEVHPKEKDQSTSINSQFSIDSIAVGLHTSYVAIAQGNYELELTKKAPKKWLPKGTVNFKNLMAYDPKLVHRLEMPTSKIAFENDNLTLDKTTLNFGDSDVELTGNLDHAIGLKNGELVTANLSVNATRINANQLMKVFAGLADQVAATEDTNETITNKNASLAQEKHAFKVPENLAFQLNTNIKKLEFGKMELNNIYGKALVENGNLKLNHLHFNTLAANLDASLTYTAKDKQKPSLDFEFYMTDIEMGKLHEMVPALDSLIPATKAFEGKADFRIKGKANLNQQLDFEASSLRGIAAMKAKDIMVLDGPTFRELAKTFMFKSKEKNPVKNLEVEMEFEEDDVHILPALLEIDRYRLAIGGVQHLDMTYDYHISVLKSPVPFKTGVDVAGKDFDDYDISITRAKYKYYFTDKKRLQKKADSSVIRKKAKILEELKFE
ncbi:AsmA-like C-terminal region-containing protein [Zunongwangia endophytica]|uniref:AsmA-like C-terminal region-containing protein n=1 Tax=Zunongwangia endophytica TaxID=1808945 RepID=A0ABV8H941_9FLAO|nr:AsmA-like C-terminal region-containing protein [Zunongwangia endophytica]MDN3595164.1 AsmA-like C-terminal region-containing protein [Zunongwangia endophytica]